MSTKIELKNINVAFEQLRKTATNLRPILPAIAEARLLTHPPQHG